MSDDTSSTKQVHRFIADSDALIAYARLDCWETLASEIAISTTRTCYGELTSHTNLSRRERHDETAQAKAEAAQRVLDALDDPDYPLNWHYCGETKQTGEESIPPLARQHADNIDAILMMDSGDENRQEGGRAYIDRKLDRDELDIEVPSLGVPLAILKKLGDLTESEACASIEELAEKEGWTNRGALKRIWNNVPLNCDETPSFISDD